MLKGATQSEDRSRIRKRRRARDPGNMATAAVDTGVPKAKVSATDRDGWMTTDDEFARARQRTTHNPSGRGLTFSVCDLID